MNNRSLVRTDHVLRYHLYVCTESAKFDAFKIVLLDQHHMVHKGMLVNEVPIEDLWSEVLCTLQYIRGQHDARPLYPPQVFAPYAVITACEFARESAKVGLRINMLNCNGPGPLPDAGSHESRVRALCQALDQIDFLQRRPQVLN